MAPLDWGLGHTTRCLPLIQHLQTLGAGVFFAGNEVQCNLVRQKSPQLPFLALSGYEVRYARSAGGFLPKMLEQLPLIAKRIKAEHQWLLEMVSEHHIEGIISDNRYGLWHPQVPNIMLCHQLGLHTGLGAFADRTATRFHKRLLSRFGAVWIPDVATSPGISGKLGHPENVPKDAKYIGPLSQFSAGSPAEKVFVESGSTDTQKLVVLLSGPEPQRSILSDLLWAQVCTLNMPVLFVEGKKEASARLSNGKVTWHSLLAGKALQTVLEQASYVVCRGGYTTLMDAAALHLKLLIIPTPGQGEQQYLGRLFEAKNRGLCFKQEGFNLKEALGKATDFPFVSILPAGSTAGTFKPVLEEWYTKL